MASESILKEALERVAQQNGFQSGKFTIKLTGEHEYMHTGMVKQYEITEPPNQNLKLSVRLPPTVTDKFLLIPMGNWFKNNVHFYKNVYTRIKSYGGLFTVPKFYSSSMKENEEYIILEDLEASGYHRPSMSLGLDRIQLKVVLTTLSMFHQTVATWKNRDPADFKKICSEFRPVLGPKYPYKDRLPDYEKCLRTILQSIWYSSRTKHSADQMRKHIVNLLDGCPGRLMRTLEDDFNLSWSTLVNCTMWTPNLLFRNHTVSGTPVDVAVDEWGATRIGSPALDLSLLIYASPATSLLPEIDSIISEHFTGQQITSEFEKHFPIYGVYGVYAAIFINLVAAVERSIQFDQITFNHLVDKDFKSDDIPDIKERLVAIINAASARGII